MPATLNDEDGQLLRPRRSASTPPDFPISTSFLSSGRSTIFAVIIARRGKLVLERYFSGEDERWVDTFVRFAPREFHDVRSISRTCLFLVGIRRVRESFRRFVVRDRLLS